MSMWWLNILKTAALSISKLWNELLVKGEYKKWFLLYESGEEFTDIAW